MVAIGHIEFAALRAKRNLQLAALQHGAVMIMQNRDEHFSMQLLFQRMPVDIEETGIDGSLPVFQHVQPPGVVATHDSHVIGHDIDNQPHVVFAESRHKAIKFFRSSDLGIQGVVIDDVVAVHAARPRLEEWRDVAMADAESGEVGNDCRCLHESKIAIELQAIGCERMLGCAVHDSRNQTTDQAAEFLALMRPREPAHWHTGSG